MVAPSMPISPISFMISRSNPGAGAGQLLLLLLLLHGGVAGTAYFRAGSPG
jgi:hypothetical protein